MYFSSMREKVAFHVYLKKYIFYQHRKIKIKKYIEASKDSQPEDRGETEEMKSLKAKIQKLETENKRLKNQTKEITTSKTNEQRLDTSKG